MHFQFVHGPVKSSSHFKLANAYLEHVIPLRLIMQAESSANAVVHSKILVDHAEISSLYAKQGEEATGSDVLQVKNVRLLLSHD
jgi:hypothetical protein